MTFDIDANGILNVNAKDLGTGKEQKITITASSGLSEEDIEKMKQDAESHAEDDKKRREEVDLRNNADNLAYQTEKMLKDNGDKIPDDKKSAVEAANNELKEALKGTAADAIKAATEKLQQVVQDASQDIYKAAQEAQAAGQAGGAEPDGERRCRPGGGSQEGRRPHHRRRGRGGKEGLRRFSRVWPRPGGLDNRRDNPFP